MFKQLAYTDLVASCSLSVKITQCGLIDTQVTRKVSLDFMIVDALSTGIIEGMAADWGPDPGHGGVNHRHGA